MAVTTPQGRTHRSADALFRFIRNGFATIPDHRKGEGDMALPDALMAGFALFSLQSPSLLAFDKQRVEGN